MYGSRVLHHSNHLVIDQPNITVWGRLLHGESTLLTWGWWVMLKVICCQNLPYIPAYKSKNFGQFFALEVGGSTYARVWKFVNIGRRGSQPRQLCKQRRPVSGAWWAVVCEIWYARSRPDRVTLTVRRWGGGGAMKWYSVLIVNRRLSHSVYRPSASCTVFLPGLVNYPGQIGRAAGWG